MRGGAVLAACSPSSGLEHLLRAGGVCGRAKSAEGLYFVMANDEYFASSRGLDVENIIDGIVSSKKSRLSKRSAICGGMFLLLKLSMSKITFCIEKFFCSKNRTS